MSFLPDDIMLPDDRQQLDSPVQAIAQILHRDAQTQGLPMESLEATEQTVRAQLQRHVSPGLGDFLSRPMAPQRVSENSES